GGRNGKLRAAVRLHGEYLPLSDGGGGLSQGVAGPGTGAEAPNRFGGHARVSRRRAARSSVSACGGPARGRLERSARAAVAGAGLRAVRPGSCDGPAERRAAPRACAARALRADSSAARVRAAARSEERRVG